MSQIIVKTVILPSRESGIPTHVAAMNQLEPSSGGRSRRQLSPEQQLIAAQSWVALACNAEMIDTMLREYGVSHGVPQLRQQLANRGEWPQFQIDQWERSIWALEHYDGSFLAQLRERSDKIVDAQKLLGVDDAEVLELIRRAEVFLGLRLPDPGEWQSFLDLPVPVSMKSRMPKRVIKRNGYGRTDRPFVTFKTPVCLLAEAIEVERVHMAAELETLEGSLVRAFPQSIADAYRLPNKEQWALKSFLGELRRERGVAWTEVRGLPEDPELEDLDDYGRPVSEYDRMDHEQRSNFYRNLNLRLRDKVRNSKWAQFEEHLVVLDLATNNRGPETGPRTNNEGTPVKRDALVMDVFPDVVPRIFRRLGWAGQVIFVRVEAGQEFLKNSLIDVEIGADSGTEAPVIRRSNGKTIGWVPAEAFRGRRVFETAEGEMVSRTWVMDHGRITVTQSHPWFRGGSEYAEGWARPQNVNTPALMALAQEAAKYNGLIPLAQAEADTHPLHVYQLVMPGWCKLVAGE